MNRYAPRRQRGVSLIEVMVAIVVFGIGMLGLALLQTKGAQFTKESSSRTSAIIQARSLADAMRANPLGVVPADGSSSYYLYDGTVAPDPSACSSNLPCAQAKTDLKNWLASIKAGTIAAQGVPAASVSRNATLGTFTVTVSWNGMDVNGDKQLTAADNGTYSFSLLP
ncbi:MAG: type IV pilus modification protein PilV [Frateuria sp.]|uniref:type IV pilus modification protein PilV n=1 Tax=Frateuria sp. TaxID=2211372 RepID=UPI0017D1AE59|nr:type IV pilus modification protein PilV [Frateuria sp.]NUO73956.1 type IV pilus modification protein PilV [Frateuria sp.]NUR22529.1 type IV pilus modification protein PilV [Frateuria sp.]